VCGGVDLLSEGVVGLSAGGWLVCVDWSAQTIWPGPNVSII
jgi:hypothetical protein